MIDLNHSLVRVGEVRLHVAEVGDGPLVILVHGFPESWFSWRHQLGALADAGYRAAAIDVRGYGRSSKPPRIEDYSMMRLVGDVVGLVAALGESRATLVGHDWGAPIVWNSALLRPDLFRGVAGLSVPYSARNDVRPSEALKAMAGEDEFYVTYFQEPGRAEREIEEDVAHWLLGFYHGASAAGAASGENLAIVKRGGRLKDSFNLPSEMPDWLPQADFDYYVNEFERTGLTGGLNRYRNVDRDWEDFAAFSNEPIEIPALFVGGDRDGPTVWGQSSIERFSDTLPQLHRAEILDDCGHWVQQEQPEQTNELLCDFLKAVHTRSAAI